MHDEDQTYTPLSAEPLDMAQRLRGYIDGLVSAADRDKEDPPWFISLCEKETNDRAGAALPSPQGTSASTHENHAQGCRTELSSGEHEQTALSTTHRESGSSLEPVPCEPGVRGNEQEIREAGGQVKMDAGDLSGTRRNITEQLRKKLNLRPHMQRRIIQATLQHVLRLEYHLRCFILFLTAQIIELGRAGEPPEPREPPQPRDYALARKGDQELRDAGRDLPRINSFKVLTPVLEGKAQRRRGRGPRPYLMLPDSLKVIDAGHVFARIRRLEHVLANADKFAMSLAKRAVQKLPSPPSGGRGAGGEVGVTTNSVSPSSQTLLPEGEGLPILHPLYFAPLANFCPPAEHYDSAPDIQQKRDFNLIHFLASSRLEQIGLGVRPDPYRGLPDLSCLDPPKPPQIRSL